MTTTLDWTFDIVTPEKGGKYHLRGDFQETWCGKYYDLTWNGEWRLIGAYSIDSIKRMVERPAANSMCVKCAKVWKTT
jgi:hypothetical protein